MLIALALRALTGHSDPLWFGWVVPGQSPLIFKDRGGGNCLISVDCRRCCGFFDGTNIQSLSTGGAMAMNMESLELYSKKMTAVKRRNRIALTVTALLMVCLWLFSGSGVLAKEERAPGTPCAQRKMLYGVGGQSEREF